MIHIVKILLRLVLMVTLIGFGVTSPGQSFRFGQQASGTRGENILILHDASGYPSTVVSIDLEIINDDPFVGFQLDIPMNEGFVFVQGSASLNPERQIDHILEADMYPGTNLLRLLSVSFTNASFNGNSGIVATFSLMAPMQTGVYSLEIQDGIIGNIQTHNILTQTVNATITIAEAQQIPAILNLNDILIASPADTCFAATQAITTTGFSVEEGASVTFEAGESITLLPATHIQAGAYFSAFISDDSVFCTQTQSLPEYTQKHDPPSTELFRPDAESQLFTIFPNPTTGLLTLSFNDQAEVEPQDVLVYNFAGILISRFIILNQQSIRIDLGTYPPGMYIIGLSGENYFFFEKAIKL